MGEYRSPHGLDQFHDYSEFNKDSEIEKDNMIKRAMVDAGIDTKHVPKIDSPVYQRMIDIAEKFINSVDLTGKLNFDQIRRSYHDQLCMMIYGKERRHLTNKQLDQAADFAAYLTNRTELVGTW